MSHSTDFTGKELQPLDRKNLTTSAILHTLSDLPRKKAAEMLTDLGIHEDYLEDALNGRPYGAKVIDLAEYRWMRLFDEL